MTRTKLLQVLLSALTIAGTAYILNGHFALAVTLIYLAMAVAIAVAVFTTPAKGDTP